MKKIKNIVVFNSVLSDGTMKSNQENKEKFASKIGFDANKLMMQVLPNKDHPVVPGTLYTLKPEDLDNYKNLYYYDVWANGIKLTKETPNAAIGFNIADGANVIAMNIKTLDVTSTFCDGAAINRFVPLTIASTLGGNPEDIIVDVSPFAYTIPFVKGEILEPNWISNKIVWGNYVEDLGDSLIINQKGALYNQLLASGIKVSNINLREDTLLNDKYFSHQSAKLVPEKYQDGRFMHGAMYEFEGEEKEYTTECVKKYVVR